MTLLTEFSTLSETTMATIARSAPFTIRAFTTGIDTDSVRCSVNGTPNQTRPISELVGGAIDFPFPSGLTVGTYSFLVEGLNAQGVGPSQTLSLSVVPGLPAPITTVILVAL
jgi:hypothetical protein